MAFQLSSPWGKFALLSAVLAVGIVLSTSGRGGGQKERWVIVDRMEVGLASGRFPAPLSLEPSGNRPGPSPWRSV